jgi:hypothetical protein
MLMARVATGHGVPVAAMMMRPTTKRAIAPAAPPVPTSRIDRGRAGEAGIPAP